MVTSVVSIMTVAELKADATLIVGLAWLNGDVLWSDALPVATLMAGNPLVIDQAVSLLAIEVSLDE